MANKVGRPKIFKTEEDIIGRVTEYKKYLEEHNKLPTMAGLAYYLEIDRQTLYNYAKDAQFFDIIKRYRDWVMFNIEQHALEKGNAGTIFVMKNYGYTDKQEIKHDGELNTVINIIPVSKK